MTKKGKKSKKETSNDLKKYFTDTLKKIFKKIKSYIKIRKLRINIRFNLKNIFLVHITKT